MSSYKRLSREVLSSLPNGLKSPEELDEFLISSGPLAFQELENRINGIGQLTPEVLLLNERTFGSNSSRFKMSDIIIFLLLLFLALPFIISFMRSKNIIYENELVFCNNIDAFSIVDSNNLAFRKDIDIVKNKGKCLDSEKYKDLKKKYDITGKRLVKSVRMGDSAVETSVAKVEFQLPESPVNIIIPLKTRISSEMQSGSTVHMLAVRPRSRPVIATAIFIGKDADSNTVSLLLSKENAKSLAIGNEGSFQIMNNVKILDKSS